MSTDWDDNTNSTWEDTLTEVTWSEIKFVATFLDSIGEEIERKEFKKRVNRLKKKEKERFIEIYCKVSESEYTVKKKKKKVELTVEDIKFIIKEVIKVDVKIIN